MHFAYRSLFFVFCLLLASVSAGDHVVEANSANFDNVVLKSKIPVMVEFYAPWCRHCKDLVPIYESAAERLKNIATFAKVDATSETSLASIYSIRGYPTLKLFVPEKHTPFEYTSQRTTDAITNFVTNHLTNHVTIINDWNDLERIRRKSKNLPLAIVFSSKSTTSPMLKSLSMRYLNQIVFAQVNSTSNQNTALMESYGVKTLPSVFLQLPNHDEQPIAYTNQFDSHNFIAFFEQNTRNATNQNIPKRQINTNSHVDSKWNVVSDFEKFQEHVSTKISLILLNHSPESELAQKLLELYKNSKTFSFIILDQDLNEQILLNHFKLDPQQEPPTLIVYNSKRHKYAASIQNEFIYLTNLIDRVLSGDIRWNTIKN